MGTFYLDPDDEITKAAALIRNAREERVSLVVPPGSRVATSRMNFRLLAKEAQSRHRRLSIVAPDAASRALAASAGLPVYATVSEQEADETGTGVHGNGHGKAETAVALDELAATVETPRHGGGSTSTPVRRQSGPPARANLPREHTGPSLRAVAAVLVLLVLLVGGGVAAYLFVPSASVTLTPRAEAIAPLQLTVKIDPGVKSPDAANLVVPGVAQSIPVRADGKFDATGQKVNDTKASGLVTFTNKNNDHGVTVPASTQVWTDQGTVFLTTAAVFVPKATLAGVTIIPSSADAAIDAQKPGLSGNVPAGTIRNLPASLNASVSNLLSVSNANPTKGGTHTVTPIIQQSDIDTAKGTLQSQLQQQFVQALTDPSKAPPSMKVFPDTGQLGTPSFDPDPATLVGQTVDAANPKFDLAVTAAGTVTAANLDAVRTVADGRLRSQVPAGRSLQEGSVRIDLGDGVAVGNIINVPVTATARTTPILDAASLKSQITGKSQAEAKRILSQYGDVDLSMSPDWVPNLPGYGFRIDFRIVEPSPPAPTPTPTPTPTPASTPTVPATLPPNGGGPT